MKILILGGMHGNELLGLEVVKLFQQSPVANVTALVSNEQATNQGVRFTGKDLNRSFPGSSSGSYEDRRASYLLELTKTFDIVLDFHNTHCPNNDCSFVGETAKPTLFDASYTLGLSRTIVADYDCINKYASNCISIEISVDSPQNNARMWYKKIKDLVTTDTLLPSFGKLDTYKFVYRMTLEDRERLNLSDQDLQAFIPIDPVLAAKLGVNTPAYPIFIGDKFTPYNYGGVLNRIN